MKSVNPKGLKFIKKGGGLTFLSDAYRFLNPHRWNIHDLDDAYP